MLTLQDGLCPGVLLAVRLHGWSDVDRHHCWGGGQGIREVGREEGGHRLCAFLVGVMRIDTIAGEVSWVGIIAAELMSISGGGDGGHYIKERLPHSRIAHA